MWDNFESVREMPDPAGATPPLDEAGCADLAAFLDWVQNHSSSVVLITSRAQETWLGEVRRIGVGGLNRAESAQYAGYLLEPYPAAQRRRDRRSFGDLLDWLDGHPLAMRLTLPRLDVTDPAELLAGLRGIAPLAATDIPDADRTTSLAASITYSYEHLADQTRRLLPAVSLFHGIADAYVLMLFSAEQTVPGRFAGISQDEWSAVLDDAARVGLLTALGGGMYQIHPALPGYLAADWHAGNPDVYDQERRACEQSLCAAYAGFSRRLTRQIASGDAALAYTIIGSQRRTLGAMLGYALDRPMWQDAESIVRALNPYWETRGLIGEAGAWADRILNAAVSPNAPAESADSLWLYTAMVQANRQRDAKQMDQAGQTYRSLLTYLQNQPETEWVRQGISVAYHHLGLIAQDLGRLGEADDWYRQSLAISEELGNRLHIAASYFQLGRIAQDLGRLGEADDWYRQSLAISEELSDRPHVGLAYHQLGIIAKDQGRLDEADDWSRKALDIREGLGDRPGMALTYHLLGMTAEDRGRLGEAEDWYRRSLAISEGLGQLPNMMITYHHLGRIAQARGRLDEAEDWYRKSLAIEEKLGNLVGSAKSYGQLGLLAEARQQPRRGLEWMVKCVSLFAEFPHPATQPGPYHLARLTRQLGVSALEEAWERVTGQALPQPVRDYVTSHHDEEPVGES